MTYIVLIIVVLIILLIYNRNKNNIEHYDDIYTDKNVYECGKLCKTTEGCYAFAFDKDVHSYNKIVNYSGTDAQKNIRGNCYLSTNIISGMSVPYGDTRYGIHMKPRGIYGDRYKHSHTVCNKVLPINGDNCNLSFPEKKGNSIFICTKGIQNPRFLLKKKLHKYFRSNALHPQYYMHTKDKFIRLAEGQNFDYLLEGGDYKTHPHVWPKSIDSFTKIHQYDVNKNIWPRSRFGAEQRDTLIHYNQNK